MVLTMLRLLRKKRIQWPLYFFGLPLHIITLLNSHAIAVLVHHPALCRLLAPPGSGPVPALLLLLLALLLLLLALLFLFLHALFLLLHQTIVVLVVFHVAPNLQLQTLINPLFPLLKNHCLLV